MSGTLIELDERVLRAQMLHRPRRPASCRQPRLARGRHRAAATVPAAAAAPAIRARGEQPLVSTKQPSSARGARHYGRNWVSPSLPRCPGVAGTRWLDDGVVGRGSSGEGLLGEAMEEQAAGL